MSELKQLYVPPPTTEEYGGFKVTKEYVLMDEFERGIKTADTMSVVRCKDCKHYDRMNDDEGMCMVPDDDGDYARWMVDDVGFCAWGIRREHE